MFVGSVELAAVGVSASVFNLVSKLFNVPLLNVTTAFVAEEQAIITKGCDHSIDSDQSILFVVASFIVMIYMLSVYLMQPGSISLFLDGLQDKKVLPSVSTSLVLAATIGVAEAVALSVGSGFLMNTMGIPFVRDMYYFL